MTQAHDKLIGPVPSQIVNLARLQVTPYEGRVAEFNVAAWLQLPGLANLPVSLLMSYLDGTTRREVMIDHGKVSQHNKILLSGVARLPVEQAVGSPRRALAWSDTGSAPNPAHRRGGFAFSPTHRLPE